MRFFTNKKTMLAVFCFCLCSTAFSQTKEVTIDAGKLSEQITEEEQTTLTSLKITGKINGSDIQLLRKMAGKAYETNAKTNGKLSSLDLSQAQIVAGGSNYYVIKRGLSSQYYQPTEDNVIAPYMFTGLTTLTTLKLPTNITKIEKFAFAGCSNLTECTIPESVTTIGDNAFAQCSKLKTIAIPSAVTSLGVAAFKGCEAVTNVTFAKGIQLEKIGKEVFSNNSSLTAITLPKSVTEIEERAFYENYSLASITFPSGLTSIGVSAFENCLALTTLSKFPSSLENIEDKAFLNTSVTAFTVSSASDNYTSEDGILYDVDKVSLVLYPAGRVSETLNIPETVSSIAKYAFAYAKNLKSIELPSGLTNINDSAFVFSKLTSVTTLASNLAIAKHAFSNCLSLTTVDFKGAIASIGDGAFQNDKKLSTVKFVGTSIPDFGKYVFTPKIVELKIYVPSGYVDKYKEKIEKKPAVLGAKYQVLGDTTDGVLNPSFDSNVFETARYNVDGTKVTTRTKGLNIIKLSDGSVIKTFEK